MLISCTRRETNDGCSNTSYFGKINHCFKFIPAARFWELNYKVSSFRGVEPQWQPKSSPKTPRSLAPALIPGSDTPPPQDSETVERGRQIAARRAGLIQPRLFCILVPSDGAMATFIWAKQHLRAKTSAPLQTVFLKKQKKKSEVE